MNQNVIEILCFKRFCIWNTFRKYFVYIWFVIPYKYFGRLWCPSLYYITIMMGFYIKRHTNIHYIHTNILYSYLIALNVWRQLNGARDMSRAVGRRRWRTTTSRSNNCNKISRSVCLNFNFNLSLNMVKRIIIRVNVIFFSFKNNW